MTARSLALAVGTVAIEHRRMTRSGIGLRVNRIAPEPRYARPAVARRQRPERRVVSPDPLLADDILADALGHRQHPPGDMPHPLGHGGAVDLDAFALQDDGLPIERDAGRAGCHRSISRRRRWRAVLVPAALSRSAGLAPG